MVCDSHVELGSSDHLKSIFAWVERERLPINGAFDLTYRCNCRCIHCYAGHLTGQSRAQASEMDTREVVELLAAAADAGCLLVLLSGGEPLLRRDFVDIYAAAKGLGLIVTVFTNASLITEAHLDVFAQLPPHMVEVSVYGATEATYEKVTGAPGSFRRARRGIEQLLDRGVRVGVKSMILRDNVEEIGALEAWAGELGLPFRLDALVTPRLNGDLSPLHQRVNPSLAAELEMGREEVRAEVARYLSAHDHDGGGETMPDDRLYRCGAGIGSFHVDPRGFMHPCMMSTAIAYNALAMGFADAWKAVKAAVDGATWDATSGCAQCPDLVLCGYCPALFQLENSSPSRPPEYVCRLGESRRRVVGAGRPEVCRVGSS
jgi:MoaA/NifB/PqqE/SkfB family radical SAM enzyme